MAKKILDFICVGNAMIDMFLSIHNATKNCRVEQSSNELCVRYGEKILLDDCAFLVGGNATNVSVGLSRLGYEVGLVAEIGEDEFASKIEQTVKKEGVDTALVTHTKNGLSSFGVGIQFQNDRTIFVKHVERAHSFDLSLARTQWVYLTSLGEEWKIPYKRVLEYVRRNSLHLAFNPGSRQLEEENEQVSSAMALSEVLFVNKEEANRLLFGDAKEKYSHETEYLLEKLRECGPQTVLITDGQNGSYGIDVHGQVYHQESLPCTIVEKTGAGDAYATGFLGAYAKGYLLQDAMIWGSVNAASVIGQVGAQAGLLTKRVIHEKVKELLYERS